MTHARTLALALHVSIQYLPAWRRLQVPRNLPLGVLHQLLQRAFHWGNARPHVFYRRAGEGLEPVASAAEDHTPLSALLPGAGSVLAYVYDPGQADWAIDVRSEGLVPALHPDRVAFCTDGDGRSPPEGCGGIPAYLELLDPEPDWAALAEAEEAGLPPPEDPPEPPVLKRWSEPMLAAQLGPAFHPDRLNARLADPAFTGELEHLPGKGSALLRRVGKAVRRSERVGISAADLDLVAAALEACPSLSRLRSAGEEGEDVLGWLRDTLSVAAGDRRVMAQAARLAALTGEFGDGFAHALAVARHEGTGPGLRALEPWRDQAQRLGDAIDLYATEAFLHFVGGEAGEAEARLRRLIASEPDPCLREPAVERLVAVLDGTGREAEAQRLYEDESDAVLGRLDGGLAA